MQRTGILQTREATPGDSDDEVSDDEWEEEPPAPLYCRECDLTFTSESYLYRHLIHHVRQPFVTVAKLSLPDPPRPSLKLVLKNRSGNSFEIVNSPSPRREQDPYQQGTHANILAGNADGSGGGSTVASGGIGVGVVGGGDGGDCHLAGLDDKKDDHSSFISACFSDAFGDVNGLTSPALSDPSSVGDGSSVSGVGVGATGASPARPDALSTPESGAGSEYGGGGLGMGASADPTPPPPDPAPVVDNSYPKIRIKTTGLLKEPLTITEITDDNPDGIPQNNQSTTSSLWGIEDPLKLPEDDHLLSLFNNNERAKDLGFTSSESEFMSLDRLDDRNRGALQLYNPNNAVAATSTSTALQSLSGLPMQALAQQVSRLQPSGNGMQQNVLINIQQFPQAPPPPPQQNYQQPPMYHHPPPPQQMYQPYQYQPPNPYYPQPPGYPQHMPPPPPPQGMGQMGQPPMGQPPMPQGGPGMGQQQPPPMGQGQMGPGGQQPGQQQPPGVAGPGQPPQQPMQPGGVPQPGQYRQPMPPRPGQRMPPARQPGPPRAPGMPPRQRAPPPRPRGPPGAAGRGGVRPRAPGGGQARPPSSPVKRAPDQAGMQAKKKRFDMLTPDKDDDDCQVICMQPKNMDGGLPQIESVSGADSAENSIMHLSDSITLSVRNPPPKEQQSPKKSEANAVANILATRGITVTASGNKPKEKEAPQGSSLSAALNLNGAVSIIPAGKNNGNKGSSQENQLPTVDLTDDSADMKMSSSSKQKSGLPFRCELCQAQYPTAAGLGKHREDYHKTTSGMPELGIPVVNLKQPGIMQKLSGLGINNYIPLPASGANGTFGIPIISTRNSGNVAALGAQSMITLGPIRNIPRPSNATVPKPKPQA